MHSIPLALPPLLSAQDFFNDPVLRALRPQSELSSQQASAEPISITQHVADLIDRSTLPGADGQAAQLAIADLYRDFKLPPAVHREIGRQAYEALQLDQRPSGLQSTGDRPLYRLRGEPSFAVLYFAHEHALHHETNKNLRGDMLAAIKDKLPRSISDAQRAKLPDTGSLLGDRRISNQELQSHLFYSGDEKNYVRISSVVLDPSEATFVDDAMYVFKSCHTSAKPIVAMVYAEDEQLCALLCARKGLTELDGSVSFTVFKVNPEYAVPASRGDDVIELLTSSQQNLSQIYSYIRANACPGRGSLNFSAAYLGHEAANAGPVLTSILLDSLASYPPAEMDAASSGNLSHEVEVERLQNELPNAVSNFGLEWIAPVPLDGQESAHDSEQIAMEQRQAAMAGMRCKMLLHALQVPADLPTSNSSSLSVTPTSRSATPTSRSVIL